ncbi:MAG: helix-turn-helix domain-containing protein [Elusimicrobiota bacterium]
MQSGKFRGDGNGEKITNGNENGETVKGYMNVDELTEYLGIAKWTLYQWVSQQRIPHYKFGGLLRFRNTEIEAWTEQHRHESRGPARDLHSAKKL